MLEVTMRWGQRIHPGDRIRRRKVSSFPFVPMGLVDGDRLQKIEEAVGLIVNRIEDGAIEAPFVSHLLEDRGSGAGELPIDGLHITAIVEPSAPAATDMECRKF